MHIQHPLRTRGSKMFMDRHVGLISRRGRAAAEFLLCFIGGSDVSAPSKSFLRLQLQSIKSIKAEIEYRLFLRLLFQVCE